MSYFYLAGAILLEVIATSALKSSEGMTRLAPTVLSLAAYGVAFYLLSLTLRSVPVGVAYAIWSGVGIVLVALIGVVAFRQHLDAAAIGGMALIVAGVTMVSVFSKTTGH